MSLGFNPGIGGNFITVGQLDFTGIAPYDIVTVSESVTVLLTKLNLSVLDSTTVTENVTVQVYDRVLLASAYDEVWMWPPGSADFDGSNDYLKGAGGKSLWGWGNNSSGILGGGTTTDKSSPIQIGNERGWHLVSTGFDHAAAVKTDGTLWTWGISQYGTLGDNTSSGTITSPTQVGTLTDWKDINVGSLHNLTRKNDNTLWTWGQGANGVVGDGTVINRSSPVQIGAATWSGIYAGAYHNLGIQTDGTLWGWGYNQYGEVGDSTFTNKSSPVQIGALTWSTASGGAYHSVAIRTGGTIWSWGNAAQGRLGNQTTTPDVNSPVQLGVLTDWSKVSAGSYHTLAIKTDGTLWVWGSNFYGQIGDGTTIDKSSPVQVGAATDWNTISATESNSTATKTDGTLWSWGSAGWGRVGDSANINRSSPVQIGALTTWTQSSGSYYRSMAIRHSVQDGKTGIFSCWIRIDGGNGSTLRILFGATELDGIIQRFEVNRDNSNNIQLRGYKSDGTTLLYIRSTSTHTTDAAFLHILSSWDLTTSTAKLYINDVDVSDVLNAINDTIDYTVAQWSVGAAPDASSKFNGCIAELYFAPNQYIDISVEANRRKFVTSNLTPVYLGRDGSLPTGTVPEMYLRVPHGGPADILKTNYGVSGNLKIVGSLDLVTELPGSVSVYIVLGAIPVDTFDSVTVADAVTQVHILMYPSVFDSTSVTEFNQRNMLLFPNTFDSTTVTEFNQRNLLIFPYTFDSTTVTEQGIALLAQLKPIVSDSPTASESSQISMLLFPNTFDTVSPTEGITLNVLLFPYAFDPTTVTEFQALNVKVMPNVADSPTASEFVQMAGISYITVSDSALPSEFRQLNVILGPNVFDPTTVTESVAADIKIIPFVFDATTLSEFVQMAGKSYITVSDSTTPSEFVQTNLLLLPSVFEIITCSEDVTVHPSLLILSSFRWRNDDGSEAVATWKANQDATTTAGKLQNFRLRVIVDTQGNIPTKQFKLQYRKVGDTTWNDVTI